VAQESTESLPVQERIKASGVFFKAKLEAAISYLQKSPAVTDSRLHAREYNDSIRELFAQMAAKRHFIVGLGIGFSIDEYHQRKQSFVLTSFLINCYATAGPQQPESPHPVLYSQLRKLRDGICSKLDLPVYIVAGSNSLNEMVRYLPQTSNELRKITGFGDAKVQKYGPDFLELIINYSREKGLVSLIHEKIQKREKREKSVGKQKNTDTKSKTFHLYKQGNSLADIARERNLTVQTIEGHVAQYIRQGDISIDELVSRDKLVIIEPLLSEYSGGPITAIKEKAGKSIGFGEIKLAIAWLEFQKTQNKTII